MNSICLSVAPNLRCQGLTRLENIVLIIPPAIELVFSLTLALTDASVRGRKRWILVLDGVSFFLLALADFLGHILNQVSSNINVFRIFDFVIAGASFLPILTYTLFLFLFARSNLVKFLPTRFSRVTTFALFAVIPPIIAFNELGSLLGISHTIVKSPNGILGLGIGFSSLTFQRISLFFSSGTLALLTLFQATLFSLSFIRLVRAFLDERRGESSKENPEAPDEVHLFRGLGWLAAGLKLGAIESVVGFANVSFAVAITRRALRLFGRGAIIIGVIKGLNVVEDFVKFESDVRARRGRSRRSKRLSRFMISNPRNSTFREMSPDASSFHAAQERRGGRLGPSPLARGGDPPSTIFGNGGGGGRGERVTVQYDGRTPPVLQMRFSTLDIDVPALPTVEKTSLSVVIEDPLEDQQSIYGNEPQPQAPRPSRDTLSPHYGPARALGSIDSIPRSIPTIPASVRTTSVASDSLDAVREIASRFPNLPPRVIPGKSSLVQQEAASDPDADWRMLARSRSLQRRQQLEQSDGGGPTSPPPSTDVSPVNSIKRKPAPTPFTPIVEQMQDAPADVSVRTEHLPESGYATALDEPASYYSSDDEDDYSISMRTTRSRTETPDLTRAPTLEATIPRTPATYGVGAPVERSPGRLATRVMAIENKVAQRQPSDSRVFEEKRQRRLTEMRRELGANNDTRAEGIPLEQEMEVPWLNNDPLTELQTVGRGGYPLVPTDVDDEDVSEAILDEAWRRAGLTRIKTVSQVRVHTTPRAEQTFDIRGSLVAVEEEDLGLPESPEDRRGVSLASLGKPARLDSGVLGEEDQRLVRQGIYN